MSKIQNINQISAGEEELDDQSQGGIMPMEAVSLNTLGAHLLFGEINTPSVYQAINFIIKSNFMFDPSTNLTMIINSPGGSVSDGFALIDVMQTSRLPIHTVGLGKVVSMGVLIISAGTKGSRVITQNTEIMAHQFSTMVYGKYHELVATQKYHKDLERTIIKHFLAHTNMTENQIKDIMFSKTDRWLTPKEAKKYGICDEVRQYIV